MGTGRDLWNEWEALYNKQDIAGVASLFTSDGVYITPNFRLDGREAIATFLREEGKAVSDINISTSRVIEDGDTVVAEWTFRSTQIRPLTWPDGKEMPVTGATLELAGVTVGIVKERNFSTVHAYYHQRTG